MTIWSNLITRHPLTSATRVLSSDLLAELSLAPKVAEPNWDAAFALKDAPWAASCAAMPRQVRLAVERGFSEFVRATDTATIGAIDVNLLPAGRAQRHVRGLIEFGAAIEELPFELAVARHVLCHGLRLEPLPMCPASFGDFGCTLEAALHARLSRDCGVAAGALPVAASAPDHSALRHVQDHLLGAQRQVVPDNSLRVFGVRDIAEEAELAAGLARRYLDAGADPGEISVMLPTSGTPADLLVAAFENAQIPLGGQPGQAARDSESEFLWLLLQALRPTPAPMVLAALCHSPLMPFQNKEGRGLARCVMEDGHPSRLPDWLRDVVGSGPRSHKALIAKTAALAAKVPALKPLIPRLAALAPEGADTTLDWERALSALEPAQTIADTAPRFADAVGLWSGEAEPLRPVRHLIVLGFAGNSYPRGAPANPLFLDGELSLIEERLGLSMPTRGAILRRNLDRFRRQLGAVSTSVDFVIPRRDLNGDRLQPAPGLALIARCMKGIEKPAELISELTRQNVADWPCAAASRPQQAHVAPEYPDDGVVRAGRDLLHLRKDEFGHMKPQSPSRLENMLTSPLVWVMREAGAKPRAWMPRGLDILTLGNLFHAVFELLFRAGETVLSEGALQQEFDVAFDRAVARKAPFLADNLWSVETANLRADALRMALEWRQRLVEMDGKVLSNEQPLAGDALEIKLSGIADAVLALPNGVRMVVDFKTAGSNRRLDRMEKGWDLQVELYRAMLAQPGNDETAALADSGEVGIAYHLLRDGVTLASGPGSHSTGVNAVQGDTSREAMERLQRTIAELEVGTLRLNLVGDVAWFEKETGITPYGLKEDALAQALSVPVPETAGTNS